MRSDFYGLPWAAQMAIRRGQREARAASARAYTIEQLDEERQTLIEALQAVKAYYIDANPTKLTEAYVCDLVCDALRSSVGRE